MNEQAAATEGYRTEPDQRRRPWRTPRLTTLGGTNTAAAGGAAGDGDGGSTSG
jgi:hypothetical protein